MGCATTGSGVSNPEALIPHELTVCQDAPTVPARPAPGQPRGDDVVSGYIAGLQGAYQDCKDTVASIAARRAALDAQAAAEKPGLHISIPFFHKKASPTP